MTFRASLHTNARTRTLGKNSAIRDLPVRGGEHGALRSANTITLEGHSRPGRGAKRTDCPGTPARDSELVSRFNGVTRIAMDNSTLDRGFREVLSHGERQVPASVGAGRMIRIQRLQTRI